MQTATKTRPCFRTDLVAQPIEEKGQVFVDVTDPDTGATFRFYEVEYSVASAMDGARDLQSLRAWARDEIGVEPTDDELTTVVATLAELGYLADAAASDQGGVELGQAGRAQGAEPRSSPAGEDVELGYAGAGAPAQAVVPSTSSPTPAAGLEESFEGLMEDAGAVPTEVSRAGTNPFARSNRIPISADDGEEVTTEAVSPLRRSEGSLRGRALQTDDEDGPTNIPDPASALDDDEVSVDLSDHLSIGTDDVKEAVRQSRVTKLPTAPEGADVADAADEPAAATEKASAADTPKSAASASAERAAVAKPTEPAGAAGPAKEGSPMGVALLVVLLVVAVAGLGYYGYAHLGLFGGGAQAAEPADAAAAAEPSPPTAVLEGEDVEPAFLEAPAAGAVSWIAASGATVAEGDEIAQLQGYAEAAEALEYQLGEEARLQDRLDQATAEDDRRAMRQVEEKVEEAQEGVTEAEEELSRFRVLATQSGIFEPEIEEGAELEQGATLGVIAAEARTIGVFEVGEPDAFAAGQAVTLAAEGAGEVASCDVIAMDASTITIACAPGSPVGPGDTATLRQ